MGELTHLASTLVYVEPEQTVEEALKTVEKCFAPSLRALATAVGEDIEKKERFFIEHVQNPEKFRQQQKTVDLTEKEESEENEKEEKKDPSPDQKTITSLFKPSQETEAKEGEKEEETKDEKTEVKQDGEMEDIDSEMEGSSEEEEYAYGEEGEESENSSANSSEGDEEGVDVETMEALRLSDDSEDDAMDVFAAQRSGTDPDAKRCCVQDNSSPDGDRLMNP